MHTFVPNKPFGSLLEISPTDFILLKTFNSKFQATEAIEVWVTDKNSKPFEIKNRINLTLVIKQHSHWAQLHWIKLPCKKMRYSSLRIEYTEKDMSFCLLLRTWAISLTSKLLDIAKKSTTDPIKTDSKRTTHKTAEATGDLIENNTADKVTCMLEKSSKKLHLMELHSWNDDADNEIEVPKERYIYLQKK